MKKVYKIILLFVAIFLLGIFVFMGYINYTIDKKEAIRAASIDKTTTLKQVKYLY